MRTFIGWALALSAGVASAQAEPVERDLTWLAASVDAPTGDIGRECLERAIVTVNGVGDIKLGRASDDDMRSALIDDVTDPDLLATRRAEADLWVKTHDPAAVAALDLDRCLTLADVKLKGAPPERPCLDVMTPAVARQMDSAETHEQARMLAACLAAPPAQAHASGTRPPCVVLLGGGGTLTGTADVDTLWFRVSSAISEDVARDLTARSYDVRPLIIDEQDGQRRFEAVWRELSARRCTRTVQISYALHGATVSGQPNTFSFRAEVLRISSTDGRTATPVSDYAKTYDFPLTPELLHSLSASALAGRIADDIVAASVLPRH